MPLWFVGLGSNVGYEKHGDSEKFNSKYAGFMLGGAKQFPTGFQLGVKDKQYCRNQRSIQSVTI